MLRFLQRKHDEGLSEEELVIQALWTAAELSFAML